MNYWQYIRSSDWKRKRKQRIALDGNRCRLCDRSGEVWELEVHHRPSSYARIPDESMEDLITLCVRCHQLAEDAIQQDKYAQQEPKPIEPMQSQIGQRKEVSCYVANIELQIDRRFSDDYALRTNRKPARSDGESVEAGFR